MISWIAAAHDETILYANLVSSLHPLPDDDELVVVTGADSIAAAYLEGQARATRPIRCYVHSDVQILDPPRLRYEIAFWVGLLGLAGGMVGLVGSRTPTLPWWDGHLLGSVFDSRIGLLDNGPGGPCAVLDGLLLATVHEVAWDVSIPGWHGYDYDACRQQLAAGRTNWCLTGGGQMVRHNSDGPRDPDVIDGWAASTAALEQKWGGLADGSG